VNETAPFRASPDGIVLRVRLTPRASRNGIDGVKQGADGLNIHARVRAVPEGGRANAALAELVADEIGVPKSTVTVVSGHSARLKSLHIKGNAVDLAVRVAAWLKRF
jgi:uncharacterized protein